jgi:hypothetical protein
MWCQNLAEFHGADSHSPTGCLGMIDHWCGSRHALLGCRWGDHANANGHALHCHDATGKSFSLLLSFPRLFVRIFAVSIVEWSKTHSRDVFSLRNVGSMLAFPRVVSNPLVPCWRVQPVLFLAAPSLGGKGYLCRHPRGAALKFYIVIVK